jgi:hypothetical protein
VRPTRAEVREADRHGHGWTTFAGVMLAIVGALNLVYGIAAIGDSKVYVGDVEYVVGDLKAWGWFLVCFGAVQVLAAFSIWNGTQWGRWIGIASAGGNAILQLLWIPALPLLSLSLFAVDVLVIYALIQYGGRSHAA